MNNAFFQLIKAGDTVIFAGKPKGVVIVKVNEDSLECAAGRVITAHQLYQREALVVPANPPPAVTAIIELQTPELRRRLVPVLLPYNNATTPEFSIGDRRTLELLTSSIHSVESAELSLWGDRWNEGKPSLDDCHSEYMVGVNELQMPEDFAPVVYI